MAAGFVSEAPNLETRGFRGINVTDRLGNVSPYYTLPAVVEKARWLFALLSVLALALSGVVAWQILSRPALLMIGPLTLAHSEFYFKMSWNYLNVDAVGTCFVILGICAILRGSRRRSPSMLQLAVMPAICVGLAAGSKYPHGLLLLPVMIAIWLFVGRGRRLEATVVAAGTAALSFLAVVPYSVLDLPAFLNGLALEAYRYANLHFPGHDASSVLYRLSDCVSFLSGQFEFGLFRQSDLVVSAIFLIGLVSAAISRWRRALALVSFPVALLALLSMQQIQFNRNILPLFPFAAIFCALGIYFVYERLLQVFRCFEWMSPRYRNPIGLAVFLGLLPLGLNKPLVRQSQVEGESRVKAVAWIKRHVSVDTTVIVPRELHFDVRPLAAAGFPVRVAKFKSLDTAERLDSLTAEIPGPTIVLVPKWKATPWGWDFDKAEDRAAKLNEAAKRAQLVPLAEFSLSRGTLVNYYLPSNGSPGFFIAGRDSKT